MSLRIGSHLEKRFDSGCLLHLGGLCALALALACSGLPAHPQIDETADGFSARRARAHYAALRELGPRAAGSDAPVQARAYVERELRWAGARVAEAAADAGASDGPVLAWLPGASEDRIVVAAPWAPAQEGAGPDDAGAALLLELIRVLARRPSPYTVGIALAVVEPDAEGENPRAAIQRAGTVLVEALADEVELESLRAVLVVEPHVGPTRGIARDLRSHPVFRDLFWRTAARLGYGERFREEGEWVTPTGLQEAFQAAGYGRVLSLVDTEPERGSLPGPGAERPGLPDPGAFEPVGTVVYEGLIRLMGRLAQIDAFSGG